MKQQNSKTKKTLLSAIIVLIVCIAMLLGTTFAWFSDSVSNTGNRIQAGKLKVKLLMYDAAQSGADKYVDISNGTGDIFKTNTIATNSNATLWEPGKTQVVYLAVENAGNLAIKYNAYIDVTDEGLVGSLEYALMPNEGGAPFDLAGKTWSDVKAITGVVTGDVAAGRTTISSGVLDEIAKGTQNERDYVALAVHMKEEAGNEYQGKDVIIDVTIAATQMTAEQDGFGSDQYDANAETEVPPTPIHSSASSQTIKSDTTEDASFAASGAITSASLPNAAAKAQIPASGTVIGGKEFDSTKENIETVLNLKVDTTESHEDSMTYEIGLSKTSTVTTTATGEKRSGSEDVHTVSDWLTANINIGAGLKDVAVTHKGAAMTKMESASGTPAVDAGGYFYNTATGILTIKSKSFSPFEVTFEPIQVSITDAIGNVTYASLAGFRDAVNAGNTFAGSTIKLLKDVNLGKVANWVPIGTYTNPFQGIFDGDNKTISNITVSGANGADGLFGVVLGTQVNLGNENRWNDDTLTFDTSGMENGFTAAVKNLNIENANIETTGTDKKATGLIGSAEWAYLYNINVKKSVITGWKGVGGIAGNINGSLVDNCVTGSDVQVTAKVYNVGGIVGVTMNAGTNLAPGYQQFAIINCTNNATVIKLGTGGFTGGILGTGQNSVNHNAEINCTNNGTLKVSGAGGEVGGIFGNQYDDGNVQYVTNCINNGTFEITAEVTNVGGIGAYSKIKGVNLVNNSNISAAAGEIAGILAHASVDSKTPEFYCCTNNGQLTNTKSGGNTYDVCGESSVKTVSGSYDTVADLNAAINAANSDKNVVIDMKLKNVSVTDMSGTVLIIPNNVQSLVSDVKVCDSASLEAGRTVPLALTIPNTAVVVNDVLTKPVYVYGANNQITVSSAIDSLSVYGTGSSVAINGNMSGVLLLGGTGTITAEIASGKEIGGLRFDGTGTYTVTNRGTICTYTKSQYGANHTISTITASNITIHNYGKFDSKRDISVEGSVSSYTMLFYGGSTADIYAYSGSSIDCERSGLLLACGSAQYVKFHVQSGAKLYNAGQERTYQNTFNYGNVSTVAMD